MVRVAVTYGAGLYIVSGGLLLITTALFDGQTEIRLPNGATTTTSAMFQEAKDIYLATLAVATTIVTYWFADRGATKKDETPSLEKPTPGSESTTLPQQEEQKQETTPDPLASHSASSSPPDAAALVAAQPVSPGTAGDEDENK